ncbi:hypothetical protein BDW60DRAFT_209430 [Aspergillus nidulans var. acristatus]
MTPHEASPSWFVTDTPTRDLTKLNVGDINHTDIDREPHFAGYPTDIEGAETIIRLLDQLTNKEGKQVLLAGHSPGSWIATQATIPELQTKPRQAEGKPGVVIGLFTKYGIAGMATTINAAHFVFNDLSPENERLRGD